MSKESTQSNFFAIVDDKSNDAPTFANEPGKEKLVEPEIPTKVSVTPMRQADYQELLEEIAERGDGRVSPRVARQMAEKS